MKKKGSKSIPEAGPGALSVQENLELTFEIYSDMFDGMFTSHRGMLLEHGGVVSWVITEHMDS